MSRLPASFEVDLQAHRLTLIGDWTVRTLDRVRPRQVAPLAAGEVMTLSTDQLGAMDTAGAMLLYQLLSQLESAGGRIDRSNLNSRQRALLELVAQRRVDSHTPSKPRENWLAQIGRASVGSIREGISYLNFLGELTIRLVPQILRPWQIRWREVINEIALAGVQALFIVGLLSFLIGMVLAYQGGATLKQYGANILIVDMIAIVTLREMAPLITAILVAGRTGSSYAAQIGTMKITEEVDALRAIGIHPLDMLVVPKVIALIIVMPLLFIYADVLGLLGGAMVASAVFDVSMQTYFNRVPEVVSLSTLLVGLMKAPVFAVVIAIIGCHQGMRVTGSAAAVGAATTMSVVQAIFTVIILDALFSVLFNMMGI